MRIPPGAEQCPTCHGKGYVDGLMDIRKASVKLTKKGISADEITDQLVLARPELDRSVVRDEVRRVRGGMAREAQRKSKRDNFHLEIFEVPFRIDGQDILGGDVTAVQWYQLADFREQQSIELSHQAEIYRGYGSDIESVPGARTLREARALGASA